MTQSVPFASLDEVRALMPDPRPGLARVVHGPDGPRIELEGVPELQLRTSERFGDGEHQVILSLYPLSEPIQGDDGTEWTWIVIRTDRFVFSDSLWVTEEPQAAKSDRKSAIRFLHQAHLDAVNAVVQANTTSNERVRLMGQARSIQPFVKALERHGPVFPPKDRDVLLRSTAGIAKGDRGLGRFLANMGRALTQAVREMDGKVRQERQLAGPQSLLKQFQKEAIELERQDQERDARENPEIAARERERTLDE